MDRSVIESLLAWVYHDEGFFDLEARQVFRQAWQVVCHVNDIPRVGDYHTFDFLGERVVCVRGEDRVMRSFHNVCRHRAARVADGDKGSCGHRWSVLTMRGAMVSMAPWFRRRAGRALKDWIGPSTALRRCACRRAWNPPATPPDRYRLRKFA